MQTLDRQQVLDAVPSNWIDNLLTGADAVIPKAGPINNTHIEKLLNAIRARIKELPIIEH